MRTLRSANAILLVSLAAAALFAACSGRSNPSAPSAQPAASGGFGSIAIQSAAQCFQFVGNPACFSGARLQASGAAAGAIAPSAPTGLAGSASGTTVVLTWNAPAGGDPPTGYIIEAGSSSGQADLANIATGNTATTLSAPGVPAGTYFVRVRATNASGNSAPSNEVTITVGAGGGPSGCTAAPGAPSGLSISFNSGGTVVLSWNGASGSNSTYLVEAGSSTGASDLVNSDLGSAATTLTATGVGAGTYYVRVRGKNACGTGPASNEVVLVVGSTAPAPGSVAGTWRGLLGSVQIVLTLSQNGTQVTGDGGTTGDTGGPDGLTVSGTILNGQLSIQLVSARGACSATFVGSLTSATTLSGAISNCRVTNAALVFTRLQ